MRSLMFVGILIGVFLLGNMSCFFIHPDHNKEIKEIISKQTMDEVIIERVKIQCLK